MFIEPSVICKSETRVPDIVICNTRFIIGVLELKYLPRTQPGWQKDIATFRWMLKNRDSVFVSNTRYKGPVVDARSYPMAEDVLFVWAGVHAESEITIANEVPLEFNKHFLELHAETRRDGDVNFR